MTYGKKLTFTCANCGKQWEALKSQAKQCCSKECGQELRIKRMKATKNNPEVAAKIKASRIEKFGSWNPPDIGARIEESRRRKNGGEFASKETREKLRQAQLNSSRTSEDRRLSRLKVDEAKVAEKSRATREARYGEGVWLPEEAIKKAAASKEDRYGPDYAKKFVEARKSTMLKKYGVEHALQIPGKAQQASNSYDRAARAALQAENNLQKYGVHNPMMVPEIAAKSLESRNRNKRPVYFEMRTKEWWDREYKDAKESIEGLSYKFSVSTSHLGLVAKELNYPITNPISTSVTERKLGDAIEALGVSVIRNSKKIIPPQEIDIFLPEHNLAIEVNGVYWHSEEIGGKGKDYHRDKMLKCEAQGIRLIQFWDTELTDNFELCVSMISSILGRNQKVHARKCEIEVIDAETAKEFMNTNHLQGFRGGNHIGLYRWGALAAVMTTGASQFRRNCTEIKRFATLRGITVIGGFSKLLATISGPIVSYSDNRYSRGGVYARTGFSLDRDGAPTPWYTKDCVDLHHRSAIIDKNRGDKTQKEAAKEAGWMTIWDAGQRTWIRP